MTKDIAVIPTNVYSKAINLMSQDTDHADVSAVLEGATVTNDTDQIIYLKQTSKGTPTGVGRKLDIGQSIVFSTFDGNRVYIKAASTVNTGAVIISGDQQ